jgi:hypothetical protein
MSPIGTFRTCCDVRVESAFEGLADFRIVTSVFYPRRTAGQTLRSDYNIEFGGVLSLVPKICYDAAWRYAPRSLQASENLHG